MCCPDIRVMKIFNKEVGERAYVEEILEKMGEKGRRCWSQISKLMMIEGNERRYNNLWNNAVSPFCHLAPCFAPCPSICSPLSLPAQKGRKREKRKAYSRIWPLRLRVPVSQAHGQGQLLRESTSERNERMKTLVIYILLQEPGHHYPELEQKAVCSVGAGGMEA